MRAHSSQWNEVVTGPRGESNGGNWELQVDTVQFLLTSQNLSAAQGIGSPSGAVGAGGTAARQAGEAERSLAALGMTTLIQSQSEARLRPSAGLRRGKRGRGWSGEGRLRGTAERYETKRQRGPSSQPGRDSRKPFVAEGTARQAGGMCYSRRGDGSQSGVKPPHSEKGGTDVQRQWGSKRRPAYVQVRDCGEASGGGVGWEGETEGNH